MHSTRLHEVLALALAAALPLFAGGPAENDSRRQEDRALAQTGLVDPALVVAWNQTINDIGFAEALRVPQGHSRPRHDAHRNA